MTVKREDYKLPSGLGLVKAIMNDGELFYYLLTSDAFYGITETEFNALLPLAELEGVE